MNQDPTRIDAQFDPTRQTMTGVARHGNTFFSCPIISQIDGDLWQGGTERGLVLPSFFNSWLQLYKWESYDLLHELKNHKVVTMYDSAESGQTLNQLDKLSDWVVEKLQDGPLLCACQAGLNRSGLVAGIALVKLGRTPQQALELLREKRSPAVLCNKTFEKILLGWKL